MHCQGHQKRQEPTPKGIIWKIRQEETFPKYSSQTKCQTHRPPQPSLSWAPKETDTFNCSFIKDYQCLPKFHQRNRTERTPADNPCDTLLWKTIDHRKELSECGKMPGIPEPKNFHTPEGGLLLCPRRLQDNSLWKTALETRLSDFYVPLCHSKVPKLGPEQPSTKAKSSSQEYNTLGPPTLKM